MTGLERLAVCLMLCTSGLARAAADPHTLLDRLHAALFVRSAPGGEQFENDGLDILFWDDTKHLLTSPSHEKAIEVLDEFIRDHGERSMRQPLQRAMLQRDLWELFDWSANVRSPPEAGSPESRARVALQDRLVTAIKRLALSAAAIRRLPNSIAEAEERLGDSGFPRGLAAADGPWQLVGRPYGPAATEHVTDFGGRSVFLVFVKFPGGREAALGYLKELREFTPALVYLEEMQPSGPRLLLRTNPATPQFPAGTQWALVRRLCLIDDSGEIRASPLAESVQVRSYAAIPEDGSSRALIQDSQRVAEFQLDRAKLPALRAVEEGERAFQFVHFRSMGVDPFEKIGAADWIRERDRFRGETLRTCRQCHSTRGILSVNTYAAFGLAANPLHVTTADQEASAIREWKSRQFDWGLLVGLWRKAH